MLIAASVLLALAAGLALSVADSPKAGAVVLVRAGEGHGSGVHIGGGYVLTAAHVVEGAGALTLKTDRGESLAAELLWANTRYDIALLRVPGATIAARRLRCADPAPGEPVSAAGNPLSLEFVTFFGHAGGPARSMGDWPVAVPLDLTVAPGMSGGPLLDGSGRVAGIVVATLRSFPIAAAVPGSVVCRLLAREAA